MGLAEAIDYHFGQKIGLYIPARNKEDFRSVILSLLEQAYSRLVVVSGELSSYIYDSNYASILKRRLDMSPDFHASFLFSKEESLSEKTPEGALKGFQKQNADLWNLKSDSSYGDRIKVYWDVRYPLNHFQVGDDTVFLQRKHKHGDPAGAFLRRNSQKFADRYARYFTDDVIKQSDIHEIS